MADAAQRRPRRPSHKARLRRWLPVAFLLMSLTVAGISAFEAYRAQRSHHATATGVLTEYGEFAAWSYRQQIDSRVGSVLARTLQWVRDNTAFMTGDVADVCLASLLEPPSQDEECACSQDLAGRYSFITLLNEPPEAARWAGHGAPPAAERTSLIEAVRADARRVYREDWPYRVLYIDDGAGPALAYIRLTPRPDRGGARPARTDTTLVGVELSREKLGKLFEGALGDEILLPPILTRGHSNRDVIQVEVLDPGGRVLFASRPSVDHAFPADDEVSAIFGGGFVRASVLPEAAGHLVIGGLPSDRTPVLLLIVALAGALAIGAIVHLRRENRLALVRQEFVASVSHELRTPLAQVRLFTDTLRLGRTHTDEQRDWALANIDRETLRLTHLVENILHFSRSERGVQAAARRRTGLTEEVRDALVAFRALVPPAKARFAFDLPDGLEAELHHESFRQVILNLLDNAVRYGRAGQTVRIGGGRVRDRIRITVDDQGPGVPSSERERIFEPFRRGSTGVHAVVAGSGIGLSVVRDIVRAHEGRVWVEDARGGGARFIVELPAISGDGAAPADAGPPADDQLLDPHQQWSAGAADQQAPAGAA
ncbi:MAG: sensor histidine kinase [Longimicrobiales bacterium]